MLLCLGLVWMRGIEVDNSRACLFGMPECERDASESMIEMSYVSHVSSLEEAVVVDDDVDDDDDER